MLANFPRLSLIANITPAVDFLLPFFFLTHLKLPLSSVNVCSSAC